MIDKRLYQETFSHLRASDQAKQEVFQKMQEMKHRKRMPRVLRGAAIAAAMVMALAVTAGAVNVATDGEFFRQFTIVGHPEISTWPRITRATRCMSPWRPGSRSPRRTAG